MDMTLLGETTAKMMDAIEENPRVRDGNLLAVGVVVVIDGEDEEGEKMTFTRTFTSEEVHYRALGLFDSALDTIRDGAIPG